MFFFYAFARGLDQMIYDTGDAETRALLKAGEH